MKVHSSLEPTFGNFILLIVSCKTNLFLCFSLCEQLESFQNICTVASFFELPGNCSKGTCL